MDEYGAAFGFFPQLKPRRNINTDTSSLPLDVFRGRLAGLLGAPSDILNLLSSPKPMEVFGDVDYSPNPQLPYGSEQWLKELPLPPTSQAGNVLGKAASFVPLNPAPVIRGVQKAGQIAGEELAATMLGQRPNSLLDKVVPKPMFAVPPEQGLLTPAPVEPATSLLQTKPQAPVSDIGFYSAAEQAAMNIKRNAGPGQAMLNDILKGENVKADEIKWMGLDDYLAGKKNVTKQEVQDYIAQNRVDVQEVQLGGGADVRAKADIDYAEGRLTRDQYNQILDSSGAPSKFGQYTLPGGENYREILLTMPTKEPAMPKGYEVTSVQYDDGTYRYFANTPTTRSAAHKTEEAAMAELQSMVTGLKGFRENLESYRSSHWDQPNVLAHIRVNDRVDADGKKMLLIEEVQSDWHQAGREKGYKKPMKELPEGWTVFEAEGLNGTWVVKDQNGRMVNQGSSREDALNFALSGGSGVPDAPFKDNWYQLALKRALKYAADNGYERVGLTTGSRQAERYDLSKQVDEITVPMINADGTRSVRIDPTEGTSIKLMVGKDGVVTGYGSGSTQFSGKKLNEVIGKEMADKVMKAEADTKFSGLDLQVGGEGMKKYYDEIYPKFLKKYGNKWGASVGETTIKIGKDTVEPGISAPGIDMEFPGKTIPAKQEPIRYIDITPEMRESVKKGQPLFTAAPLLPTTGLLADEEKRKELKSLLEY